MSFVHTDYGNVSSLRLNQDHGCFSCALDTGLKIYNIEPLRQKMHLDSSVVGSVAICEMLYRTNLLAIVGGGRKQRYAENAVLIWDDLQRTFISEFTFSSPVLSLRLRRDKLFVAQRYQIHVFSFPDEPAKLFTFDTGDNPKGMCEVSPFPSSERQLLIFPGHYCGTIQIVDIAKIQPGSCAAPMTISAHQTNIACMAINHQGTLVATASVKGTLIRVFDTSKKLMLIELRRGMDPASLYCINFSSDSEFLCASSDKGTIHIFALKDSRSNRRSRVPEAISGNVRYLGSQWSAINFSVNHEKACICAFGSNSSIYAISVDGSFSKHVYSVDGTCRKESYDNFLSLMDEEEMF